MFFHLFFLRKISFIYIWVYLCACMYMYVCHGDGVLEEGIRSCEAVVTAGCGLPDRCDMMTVFISLPVLT